MRHVATVAERDQQRAAERLGPLGVDDQAALRAIEGLQNRARLTLNFHPDRRDSQGRTVAAGLLADGRYRSQFETGISSGGRTAVPGGPRVRWETELFGGAYDAAEGATPVRPAYGALDPFGDPLGGAPRFGSAFLVLRSSCLARATFCMGDSHLGPRDVGTADQMMSVLAGAVEDCADGNGFGRRLSVERFLSELTVSESRASARELDRYIEAQIHGPIDMAADVAAIHLDPSFAGTDVHRDLRAAAERYGVDLIWSEGSEVSASVIPDDFRGPEVALLARNMAGEAGIIDPAAIGRALADEPFTSPSLDGDPEDSALQRYKKVWHCCLKFGVPAPQPRE